MPDAPDIFGTITRREAEVVGQAVPQVVPVEQIRPAARFDQRAFDSDRDGGLARGRQPGEPDCRTRLAGLVPAVRAIQRRRVPTDVGARVGAGPYLTRFD